MPEARISPKVIFIGSVRAGKPYDSTNHASSEAATGWGWGKLDYGVWAGGPKQHSNRDLDGDAVKIRAASARAAGIVCVSGEDAGAQKKASLSLGSTRRG
jgi:hypothetical protein